MAEQLPGTLWDLRACLVGRKGRQDYRIPALWNCWGYTGEHRRDRGEIVVQPRRYLAACIDWIVAQSQTGPNYAGCSLSRMNGLEPDSRGRIRQNGRSRPAGDWVREQVLYSMMLRTSTAWDHNGDGSLAGGSATETGTFLKSILLLPLLKKMGVTALYLLPVVEASRIHRKGELGSPYSAKDFFAFDPVYHDAELGRDVDDLELEFAAFVESAHRLGMRVLVDIAPRTAARDNVWVLDHPEWFYWIDRKCERRFAAPTVPDYNDGAATVARLPEIYALKDVRDYLSMFRHPPSVTHPKQWQDFAAKAKVKAPQNLLREIARQFGVTVPPAFSDVVNDPQPPWTDVTYLRLFADHPVQSARQLPDPKQQPPYVLFDTIKANVFEGKKPNRTLWDKIAGILPFYQRFGVDGARVDMAHALPNDLEFLILGKPREIDPDFCFMAEDLGTDNHVRARRVGYNMIVGPGWYKQPRAREGLIGEFLDEVRPLRVPVIASAETPDTPRAVVRPGGRQFSKQAVVFNAFVPNGVPMINTGVEVFERQPMNLGLDIVPPGRDALPPSDPQAGKLAFFDRYALHWLNRGSKGMVELIAEVMALREEFLPRIVSRRNWVELGVTPQAWWAMATGFSLGKGRGTLVSLVNLDHHRQRSFKVSGIAGGVRPKPGVELRLELVPSSPPKWKAGMLHAVLPPGDVKVVIV